MSAIQQALAALVTAAPAVTYATWNPADKGSSVILSNGDLTAAGGASNQQVRTTLSKSSGKWYWELTFDSGTSGFLGLARSSASLTAYTGQEVVSIGWRSDNGSIYTSASVIANFGTFTSGDVLGIAYDAGTGAVDYYKNNVLQGGSLGTGSLGAPLFGAVGWSLAGLSTITANFGATALTYAPPVGFNAGLYV